MEMLFLVISVLILFSAVVYWLWSHIQNVSKKAALLEAAIFDLQKMMVSMLNCSMEAPVAGGGGEAPVEVQDLPSSGDDVPVTGEEVQDMEDWTDAPLYQEGVAGGSLDVPLVPVDVQDVPFVADGDSCPHDPSLQINTLEVPSGPLDLQEVPFVADVPFVAEVPPTPLEKHVDSSAASVVSTTSSSLDAMGLKDLRRLAESRGVAGWEGLKKKELIQALKSQVAPVSDEETHALE